MLWSHHKCASAINCFCDQSSLSHIFKKMYQKKSVGETFAILWLNQKSFVHFHFVQQNFSKMYFIAKILGEKTAEYYCLTIIDHSYVISFWYSGNIESP